MTHLEGRGCRRCGTRLRRGNVADLCDPCARSARTREISSSLPPAFYTEPDVVSALLAYDFGRFFRLARGALGVTQEEFGHRIGLAQSRVCKVENGALRLRDIEDVVRLASTLEIPADLLGFVADAAILEGKRDDQVVSLLQRRDFMASVTAMALGAGVEGSLHDRLNALVPDQIVDSPRRVGLTDVERIEATTAAFRDWDNRWGGGLSRTAVIGQLQWVIAWSRDTVTASDTVRSRLLVAIADLAALGAWINYDVERHDEARRLWMIGLDASREAGNLDLAGAVLRQMAHQALHLERPEEALRLLRLAYAIAADPGHRGSELSLASIVSYEAWCHAAVGNIGPCGRALGRAEEHFDNARGEERPPWLSSFDETELRALAGHTYHVLAQRVPKAAAAAAPLLQQAASGRGPEYARRKTLNLIALASTYFQQGDGIEEGVRVGYQALDGIDMLNSPRSLARLRGLHQLSTRYASEAAVVEFRERLGSVLADAR